MSLEQLNDRFRAAAALPPEINLAQATQLFLNPPPPPPKPWYQNLMIMLPSFALMVFALFALYPESNPPLLTAFPISATTATTPSVDPLPALTVNLAGPERLLRRAIALPTLPPFITPKPATAPTTTNPTPEKPVRKQTPLPTKSQPELLPPVFGLVVYKKQQYWLEIDRQNQQVTYRIELPLSPLEQENFPTSKEVTTTLARPAGTLAITKIAGSRRQFDVIFTANETLRKRWNKAGYGDGHLPDDLLESSPILEFFTVPPRATIKYSRNLLWLLCFANNIDDEYVDMLRQAGYPASELTDLWRLANHQINKQQLREFLHRSQQVFRERPPLKYIPELLEKILSPPLISITGPPQTEYQELLGEHTRSHLLGSIQGLPASDALPVIPPSAPAESPADFGPDTPDMMVDTIVAGTRRTLKVKGRIWLYLDTSLPTGKIVIRRKADDALQVTQRKKRIILANECGAENIHVAVNPKGIRGYSIGKCAEMIFVEGEPGDRRVIR